MPNHRRVNSYTRQRSEFVGDAYEANVFGGSLNYKTDGIYLVSDNGSFIRLNRNGLFMRDADILLKNGSLNISGGSVAIYSAPNGLTSDTYMFMSNDGLSAFKAGVTSFFIDAKTGNVSLAGIISASAGSIGTWEIYPNGLSASYSGYTMYLSPEYGINYNNNFLVDSSGNMSAFNAYLAGVIVAARGRIGTWDIYSNGLSASFPSWSDSLSSLTGALSSMTANMLHHILISPEHGINYNDVFMVGQTGGVTATSALIRGSISADTGYLKDLLVIGTLSAGMYWYDFNHYINLSNSTLTAINMNDKFVVLTSGDVFLSNLSATGAIYSTSAYLGGWTVDETSIYQRYPFAGGDRGAVYLSTSGLPSSSSFPSGRAVGLQVFNEGSATTGGSSTGYFFDASFGTNLIKSSDTCGLYPSTGYFGDYSLIRDPGRLGIQVGAGYGTSSAYILFEISTLTGTTSLDWPSLKAQIAGWKFDQYGFYSCNNDFRISSSAGVPEIIIGSVSGNFIKFGMSGGNTYFTFGTTSQSVNFFGNTVNIRGSSITTNNLYVFSNSYFYASATSHRISLSSSSLTSPLMGTELVSKDYVDWKVSQISLTGLTGIAGAGTPNYYPIFSSVSTLADGSMYNGANSYDGDTQSIVTVPNYKFEAERIFTRQQIPTDPNELASKYYVDSMTSAGGHWSKTGSNIYVIPERVSIGISASFSSVLTSYKFSVSGGRTGFEQSVNIGQFIPPTSSASAYMFTVSGESYLYSSVTSGRHYLIDSSITAPQVPTELASKAYVDSLTGRATITGTPGYLSKFHSSGTGLSDSIVEHADGAGQVIVHGDLWVLEGFQTKEKWFNIEHPSDPSMRLVHSVTETDRQEVHYTGKAWIKEGKATVMLPTYFTSLVRPNTERVFVQPIGKVRDVYYMGMNHSLREMYFETDSTPECEFFWLIFAERADVPTLVVERKSNKDSNYNTGNNEVKS
jgi:hypothetical protein